MRLVTTSLQPSTLDDFVAPSRDHCVPKIRADCAGAATPARTLVSTVPVKAMARRHLTRLGRTTMESRTSTRQRLVTLAVALLGIALIYLALGDLALAEDAGPPACGGKILEQCTPNPG